MSSTLWLRCTKSFCSIEDSCEKKFFESVLLRSGTAFTVALGDWNKKSGVWYFLSSVNVGP